MFRLPVESLLRFRKVSKSWKATIDQAQFITTYSSRATTSCCFHITYKHDDDGFMYTVSGNLNFTRFYPPYNLRVFRPVSTCEGIWCLTYVNNRTLMLWNPSIRKCVTVVVENHVNQPNSPRMVFGFGLSPQNQDPTLLKINYPLVDETRYVSVFKLSSLSWSNVAYDLLPRQTIRIIWSSGQSVVGGKIFWVGFEKVVCRQGRRRKNFMIVSFNLVSHQFDVLDIPKGIRSMIPHLYYMSKLRDHLVISGSYTVDDVRFLCAWVLQLHVGVVSSYRLLFRIQMPENQVPKLLGFDIDEQPIIITKDNENALTHSLKVFNQEMQTFKTVGYEGKGGSFIIGPYKESLVLSDREQDEWIY